MNQDRRRAVIASCCVFVLATAPAPAQTPLGTAFSYQGRLSDGGALANGSYDLQFQAFDAPSGGLPLSPPVVATATTVVNGLFTASVDLGGAAFRGFKSWLEVGVRPAGSTVGFTLIGPRQELRVSPNAWYAATGSWSGLAGVPAGFADGVDNDSGGDVTEVTAGAGLTGGGSSGVVSLDVDFTGSNGAADAAARADHTHHGQAWTGTATHGLSVANSGTTALYGSNSNGGGRGVFGENTATIGFAYGLYGLSESTLGRAEVGWASATTGPTFGVWARSNSPSGTGVYGMQAATTGTGPGVYGETFSASAGAIGVLGEVSGALPSVTSAGVRGINNGTSAGGYGVWGSHAGAGWGVHGSSATGAGVHGEGAGTSGLGVLGEHTDVSGTGAGVRGETSSTAAGAAGIVGVVLPTVPGSTSAGVRGISNGTGSLGIGVYGSHAGGGWGVYGTSATGFGVRGLSTGGGTGVYGQSSATGVVGLGTIGVEGSSTSPAGYGGHFENTAVNGRGLLAEGNGTGADLVLGSAVGDEGLIETASIMRLRAGGGASALHLETSQVVMDATSGFRLQTPVGTVVSVNGSGSMSLWGGLSVAGNLDVAGSKNAIVETEHHGTVRLAAVESAETFFEDFGTARLASGEAVVPIEPVFAETVNTGVPYHVFLTPLGECALYVAAKGPASFIVRAREPRCAISFDWRLAAKRRGHEDKRLEPVVPRAQP